MLRDVNLNNLNVLTEISNRRLKINRLYMSCEVLIIDVRGELMDRQMQRRNELERGER